MDNFLMHGFVISALLGWATIGSMVVGAPILLLAMALDALDPSQNGWIDRRRSAASAPL
jgi:hypothetical protein